MVDVSELIHDVDFCTVFNVYRKKADQWSGGRQVQMEEKIEVKGIVLPASSEDIEMLPEGERTQGLKAFYACRELRLTDSETTSDICEYKGRRYRLLQVYDYSDFGYYKAIGTRIGGE